MELRLQLLPGAGREAHAEVRQAVPPRAGDAALGGAVDRVDARDRMPVLRGGGVAEQLVRALVAALDPYLRRLAPEREDADAVAARRDRVVVREQLVPADAL